MNCANHAAKAALAAAWSAYVHAAVELFAGCPTTTAGAAVIVNVLVTVVV